MKSRSGLSTVGELGCPRPSSAFHLASASVGEIHQNDAFFTTRADHCARPADMIIW